MGRDMIEIYMSLVVNGLILRLAKVGESLPSLGKGYEPLNKYPLGILMIWLQSFHCLSIPLIGRLGPL